MSEKKWKIGVFGSGSNTDDSDAVFLLAESVGKELSTHNCVVITGACSGLPYKAARAARDCGGEVWGFAPGKDYESFVASEPVGPHTDKSLYSRLIYMPKDFEFIDNAEVYRKYRNVTSTAASDAAIIISGKWGTLNEFTNLVDFGKVIGVLTETGGIADEIPRLWDKIKKRTVTAKVIFNPDPIQLVKLVIDELEKV